MPPVAAYEEGEEVLAHHGPCVYAARIVKIAPSEEAPGEFEYRVHYLNWNKSWDEWVLADRLMKKTPENITKMHEIERQLKEQKKQKPEKRKTTATKRRRTVSEVGVEEPDAKREEMNLLPMPANLKAALIADWESICKKRSLIPLPATPNIDTILDGYIHSKSNRKPEVEKDVVDVMNGIRVYFERSVGTRLLYDFERPQHDALVNEANADTPLTSLYGVQHLLRLFVLLPQLMVHSDMDNEQRQQLLQKMTPFLKYLSKNLSDMKSDSYTPMSPEYLQQLISADYDIERT
ncbi:Chromo domain-containing protein [Plasmodiophora brassicae]|uniref:Chromo domain-containing protein n=1 Tax=Plasmodiophora brassicae TaxID=37360 RepID=A0A0G4IW47_PLABS|nr:hypothetical protein PBRA_001373 [Plasmodiophora brassicae]